jgi:hypothetical protein
MKQLHRRWLTRVLGIATLIIAAIAVLGVHRIARAQCLVQQEDGHWVNIDPNTRALTRAELRFTCQDQILNGQPYPPGPPWHVHLWGKCHPTDCDWGEVGAQRLSTGHIYATYDQGFARRYVWAKMSIYLPGKLWVYTWTDFQDPARPDYAMQNWFSKVP